MPLRDHFHPPLAEQRSWEELDGAWPGSIAFRLNSILPPNYYCGPRVHLGTAIEIDVAAFENGDPLGGTYDSDGGGTAVSWVPARPTLLLDTDDPIPPEYEVRVYDERHGRRLVAAVEIVSPGNKDRPESREAFVSKCRTLLQQDVCVVIVDPVTDRPANLYAELAERIKAAPPAVAASPIYAVSCRGIRSRGRWRVEAWEHELLVGLPLPTLPLWLTNCLSVPLELEASYEDTCRGLRIA
ncbi:MAG TPA: hypothetical protein VK395_12195 [Gemmataceae bacterium]|nr:hypothetical protein [Gemmataceae bacterium]